MHNIVDDDIQDYNSHDSLSKSTQYERCDIMNPTEIKECIARKIKALEDGIDRRNGYLFEITTSGYFSNDIIKELEDTFKLRDEKDNYFILLFKKELDKYENIK